MILGHNKGDNNLEFFFEAGDIEKGAIEKVTGFYLPNSLNDTIIPLELTVQKDLKEIIEIKLIKDKQEQPILCLLKINQNYYAVFMERRNRGLHEGFRHVNLTDITDASKLTFFERSDYNQLKFYVEKYQRRTNQNG